MVNLRSRAAKDTITGYALLLPAILVYLAFTLYPFIQGFIISLCEWDGFNALKFIGLDNYKRLFSDELIPRYLAHNGLFALGTVTVKVALGFILALFLNNKFKGVTALRTIFFMPVVMSFVAIGLLWIWIFNPNFGLINSFLISSGLMSSDNPITWLADPKLALICIMIVDIWRWTGYHIVLFLAGLQILPTDMYESAMVDGATEWQQLIYITLPQMINITLVNVIFCLTGALSVFDIIFVMTNGGPYDSTQVISLYIYNTSFGSTNQFGYATTISVMLFTLVLVITGVLIKAMQYARDNT